MCRVLKASRSGFYAWLHKPLSDRAIEDQRLLGLIRASHAASSGIYGSPRVFLDLRETGETCGKHRVARLMRPHKIRAVRGYRTPRATTGRPSVFAPNTLQRAFTVAQPNRVWATDITYIRTWQGWLYLAVVMDLYARQIVGWSMKPTLARELVLDAVFMAVWRRRPQQTLIHSDQGTQYRNDDWLRFCREHHLDAEHESAWQLLGQRRGGVVLEQSQDRTHQEANLQYARSRQGRHLRLHRDVLQSSPPTQPSGRRQSRGV